MSIRGPGSFDKVHRIQPVFGDTDESDLRDGSRKRQVRYQGRSWTESEDDLPMQLKTINQPQNALIEDKLPIYADVDSYRAAKKILEKLNTIEEKIAQLCFFYTQALYEQGKLLEAEELISKQWIGGLIFGSGEYRRQTDLIEHYQTLSKIPLLIGNDFHHGLSLFFQGSSSFKESSEDRHYYDLGKVIILQNLRMGVHFQLDRSYLISHPETLEGTQRNAFCKGIRAANGVVGKCHAADLPKRSSEFLSKVSFDFKSIGKSQLNAVPYENHIQEVVGLKTVEFFLIQDLDLLKSEEGIKHLFTHSKELFLFETGITEAIALLSAAVKRGWINKAEIDKRLFKILITKSLFFDT